MEQQYFEEGQCFYCQELGHISKGCLHRGPSDQAEGKQAESPNKKEKTNLGPWQYLEDLEQSPWTEEISLESNTMTRTQEWLVKISIEQNRQVGSPAPKEGSNDQNMTMVENPVEMGWGPPSDSQWELPKDCKWDVSPSKGKECHQLSGMDLGMSVGPG